MKIRKYQDKDEQGWVRCRVLAFLHTAYYDDVHTEKEKYDHPSIELVAEEDGMVVGLIDIEYETEEGTVCSRGEGLGGMIWHIAVHPDYHKRGIGIALLEAAEKEAKIAGLNRFEAWTRDGQAVENWYEKNDFLKVDEYYHVYLKGDAIYRGMEPTDREFKPVYLFAHYVGDDIEKFNDVERKYKCMCFEKVFIK